MPESDDLGPLAYPLVQIIHGVILVAQSPTLIPLKLHMINCMQQIAASCQLFVPTAAKLIEILENSELLSKPTPSTAVGPKLHFLVKLSADSLGHQVVKDAIIQQLVTLIRQDAEIYRFNVGVPEYLFLTVRKLRRFNKKCKNSRWKDLCRALVGQLEQYSSYASTNRVLLKKTPSEITDFETLLPPGSKIAAERLANLMSSNSSNDIKIIIPQTNVLSGKDESKTKKDSLVEEKNNKVNKLKNEKNNTAQDSSMLNKSSKKNKQSDTHKVDTSLDINGYKDVITDLNWSEDDNDDDDEEENDDSFNNNETEEDEQ